MGTTAQWILDARRAKAKAEKAESKKKRVELLDSKTKRAVEKATARSQQDKPARRKHGRQTR